MHRPALVFTILALTPTAVRAEFVMQQTTTPAQASFQAPDALAERARLARAYWLRTHHSPAVLASAGRMHADTADGFGKDVPLKIAVLQILPPTLTAQFSRSVDAEQVVDWSGGKPWQAVLHDVVQPLHLRATVSGSIVRIDPAQD